MFETTADKDEYVLAESVLAAPDMPKAAGWPATITKWRQSRIPSPYWFFKASSFQLLRF